MAGNVVEEGFVAYWLSNLKDSDDDKFNKTVVEILRCCARCQQERAAASSQKDAELHAKMVALDAALEASDQRTAQKEEKLSDALEALRRSIELCRVYDAFDGLIRGRI